MKIHWLFDVDGTLTPPREKMNEEFQEWFRGFMLKNSVYLVTGSDYSKTIEQLGTHICEFVDAVYCCSGNDKKVRATTIRKFDWKLPDMASIFLKLALVDSEYPVRTGNHIEQRQGSINFSIVGRNANLEQRKHYFEYDKRTGERQKIVDEFQELFPNLDAVIGGETGIDIYPSGKDKSQIINDFSVNDHTVFFGDKIFPGGNDYTLSLQVDSSIQVDGWQDTWDKIRLVEDIMEEMYDG